MKRYIRSDRDRKRTCRIARENEFDNGRVLYNWTKMDEDQAEEIARKKSIEDPDSIYYVDYDRLGEQSDIKWVAGESYDYRDVGIRNGKITFF